MLHYQKLCATHGTIALILPKHCAAHCIDSAKALHCTWDCCIDSAKALCSKWNIGSVNIALILSKICVAHRAYLCCVMIKNVVPQTEYNKNRKVETGPLYRQGRKNDRTIYLAIMMEKIDLQSAKTYLRGGNETSFVSSTLSTHCHLHTQTLRKSFIFSPHPKYHVHPPQTLAVVTSNFQIASEPALHTQNFTAAALSQLLGMQHVHLTSSRLRGQPSNLCHVH